MAFLFVPRDLLSHNAQRTTSHSRAGPHAPRMTMQRSVWHVIAREEHVRAPGLLLLLGWTAMHMHMQLNVWVGMVG